MASVFETDTNNWINSQISETILQAYPIQLNEFQKNGVAIVFVKNPATNLISKKYYMISYQNETYNWYEIENYTNP